MFLVVRMGDVGQTREAKRRQLAALHNFAGTSVEALKVRHAFSPGRAEADAEAAREPSTRA